MPNTRGTVLLLAALPCVGCGPSSGGQSGTDEMDDLPECDPNASIPVATSERIDYFDASADDAYAVLEGTWTIEPRDDASLPLVIVEVARGTSARHEFLEGSDGSRLCQELALDVTASVRTTDGDFEVGIALATLLTNRTTLVLSAEQEAQAEVLFHLDQPGVVEARVWTELAPRGARYAR